MITLILVNGFRNCGNFYDGT